jgi:hypothetical protein
MAMLEHLELADLRSAACVCRAWHRCAVETRWAAPSGTMLNAADVGERPSLARKVKRLVLCRPHDYELQRTFPVLRSLVLEINVLHDEGRAALGAFLKLRYTSAQPKNVTLYDAIFGSVPRPCPLLLPNVVVRLPDVATLAQRRGIKCLRVWPVRLIETALTPAQRRSVFGAAPFRNLEVLAARCATAFVPYLLTLVPHVATLGLDATPPPPETRTCCAPWPDCQPALRRLTVRFVRDSAVDYDSLMALTQRRALAVLELRVGE